MVIAPHPDDEWIGPGGVVLQHHALGDPLRFVILTDGTQGDPDGASDPATYRQRREQESRRAGAQIGAELDFWGFPDGARAREEDLGVVVPRIVEALTDWRADVVYCPHDAEAHSDHYVAAIAVRRALAAMQRPPRCFGYEVWSPLRATHVVDVSAQMQRKQAAARHFESQLLHTDVVHFFSGMNAYRAVYLAKGARYGEAFAEMFGDAKAR